MTRTTSLPWPHALLALVVMAVWGTNFVVIRIALEHLPPLLLATLRFALVVAPAILFVRKPAAPWRHLAAYGLLIGAGQFGLLFIAMRSSISPGLASLVIQTQVFFTIGLAMRLTGERVRGYQWLALVLAFAGLGVILAHSGKGATPLGLALTLAAALCWAGGNAVSRASGRVNMLAYVVWSSLFAVPPLLVLSLIFDGWPAIRDGLMSANAATWAAVVWQSVGNSLFGYAAWGWLLARHPAATVTPMALLVPVFGMAASAFWLAEPLPVWKLAAAALIMSGLALNLLWPVLRARLPARARAAA
ncbi:MAG: EamA family transporter [Caulobacteraceae bacterium]|nr:EamA family transporter [Caulobacteraceae bacterium]